MHALFVVRRLPDENLPMEFMILGLVALLGSMQFLYVYSQNRGYRAFRMAALVLGGTGLGMIAAGLVAGTMYGPLPLLLPLGGFIFSGWFSIYLWHPTRVMALACSLNCGLFVSVALVTVAIGLPLTVQAGTLWLALVGVTAIAWFGVMLIEHSRTQSPHPISHV
jgi:hypothetical protein